MGHNRGARGLELLGSFGLRAADSASRDSTSPYKIVKMTSRMNGMNHRALLKLVIASRAQAAV
jgi:hypothetical protein